MDTLATILTSDNLKVAAERKHIHYRTMHFRKHKIETILGVSLDDLEIRMNLATAIKLLFITENR